LQCGHYVSKSVFSFVQHISGQIANIQSKNSNSGILVNFNKLKFLGKVVCKEEKWVKMDKCCVVFVDASDYDCGVCFEDGSGYNFKFSQIGNNFHINNKELIVAIIGLELSRIMGNFHSLVCVDNTSVLSWLKKQSDVRNVWRSFILECWSYWWRINGFTYDVTWIPSNLNPADSWTRW